LNAATATATTHTARLLRKGHDDVSVRVEAGTQLSLKVSLASGLLPDFGTVFDGVVIEVKDARLELTRCRVERDEAGAGALLMFLDDLYDCQVLINEGRIFKLSSLFDKLPLVLSQKFEVRSEFRIYVSDLIYDLNVWKKFFNEQDRIISGEPLEVARAAQQQLLDTLGPAFFKFFDEQLAALDKLVADFGREDHERHGYYFRQQVWSFIIGAEFMKRTNLKPRGYAGDSVMMQMLYDNEFVGNYVFNKLMHRHPLSMPAAQAVRNRRALVPKLLTAARERLPAEASGGFRAMSLACGPARELLEVFGPGMDGTGVHLTLLDQDTDALDTAKDTIKQIERSRNYRVQVQYVAESVRTLLRSRNLVEQLGSFHFIYSMGLFDYLTPPVAKAVLHRMYSLLEPGGSLAIGNYHASNPNQNYMAYWLDWSLYYRTEKEFLALTEGLEGAVSTIGFDASGCQMFLTVIRA
jgi:extracellular factor (EF) 3-hydroxypalmitic acid methyl ester biosynthesis protein